MAFVLTYHYALGLALALIALVALMWLRQDRVTRALLALGAETRRLGQVLALSESRLRVAEEVVRDLDKRLPVELARGQRAQQAAIHRFEHGLLERLGTWRTRQAEDLGRMRADLATGFAQRQTEALKTQQEALITGLTDMRQQLSEALARNAEDLGKRVDRLTGNTDERLREISGQVDKRLSEGFEKTTETFSRVLSHLTRIDEAQKRITELSTNVVSLQEVLADKRSRGAFGEVQLAGLVANMLPETGYSLQHGLSNGRRVDCMLFLPEPTGNVAVDAKFPLENYRRMADPDLGELERAAAERRFRDDVRRHMGDIAERYILPGETAPGAVMFIPAEAVFAEIHGRFPELVEEAQRRRVWLVSPTTLMAILTTARAVLKDEATRKQVHIIQKHLHHLSEDFQRFQSRMDRLATHIQQANRDVEEVNTSARKISSRFGRIERVELGEERTPKLAAVVGKVEE